MREHVEKEVTVGLVENAGVEDNQPSLILMRADEPTNALTKLDEGSGQGDFVEGADAPFAAVFSSRGGDRM